MGDFLKNLLLLVILVVLYIGIPVGSWFYLAPETFWQKFAFAGTVLVYEVVLVIVCLVIWVAGSEDDKKPKKPDNRS